jgi:aminopeptidase N
MTGVANGELLEIIAEVPDAFPDDRPGDRYIWEHNYPMASAFVTVAVGEYVRVESTSPGGVTLRHYTFPEQQVAYENAQANLGEMIDWMSAQFGPYPFEAFGYLTSAGMGASLETQTMVVLSENGINSEVKLAHEMAHMWFGDWVSLDSWGDIWRSEGFATYIADLWLTRENPAALERQIDLYRDLITETPMDYPLNDPPRAAMFGRDSYLKGAVLVHELRLELGDEAFFSGLRAYIQEYGGGTASHEEFQAVMEAAAGKSLEDFFEAWFE